VTKVTNNGPVWSIRSVLLSVSDLDHSSTFFQDVMNMHEVHRDDQTAVLAGGAPRSMLLYMRRAYRNAVHPGSQALGVRMLSCDVGSFPELDRVEKRLRALDSFRDRIIIPGGERLEAVLGYDPDRLALAFVAQQPDRTMTTADYEEVWTRIFSVDV
jgi:catechol-2,3-dioxygenase